MPLSTRPRRTRTRRIDMLMDSDVEMETTRPAARQAQESDDEEASNIDIEAVAEVEGDDEGEGDEEDEEDEDDEDDEEDEIQSDAEELQPKASGSRLKIRLKMPTQSSSRFETPLVESEDSMDSMPSSTRPLTTRQAVLASVMDSSHVSLGASRQKKAPLNETELALRREETARKRKNMTEKKLEDEKAETINRLLKKQSRPRKKRNANAIQRADMDDIAPPTRSNSNSVYNASRPTKMPKKVAGDEEQEDEEAEDEEAIDEAENIEVEAPEREVQVPTMYRWVSSSRIPAGVESDKPADVQMYITFSVPVSALPSSPLPLPENPVPRPTTCAAPGCGKPFRYRLVKDWTRGACGISCLRALEGAMDVSP